jgi:hypothetical protein
VDISVVQPRVGAMRDGCERVFQLCSTEEYSTTYRLGLLQVHKFLRGVLERICCDEDKCAFVLRTYLEVRVVKSRDREDADKVLIPG